MINTNKKNVYEISEKHFDELSAFSKKVTRHKNGICQIHVLSKEIKNVAPEGKPDYYISFVKFTLEISNLQLGKWQLIAKKEKVGNAVVVYQCSEEHLDKAFWKDDFTCNHCNTNRERKYVYILKNNETGDLKQVGKSCLEEFCGINVSQVVEYWNEYDKLKNYINDLTQEDVYNENYNDGKVVLSSYNYINTKKFLAYCYISIKTSGYISKNDAYESAMDLVPTTTSALKMLKNDDIISEKDNLFIEEVIDYFINLDLSNKDSFLLNSQELLKLEFIPISKIGYIAFIPNSYLHYLERKREKEEKSKLIGTIISDYAGNVGDKLNKIKVTYLSVHTFSSDFGVVGFFTFKDEKGRKLVWKTSTSSKGVRAISNIDPYQDLILSGTIKELSEFNGIKQTVLTRCKLEEIK